MPTTYAHYRFGQEVKQCLSPAAAQAVAAHPQLYDIGLHGPDILFYYLAWKDRRVNYFGRTLHKQSGADFFERAAKIIRESEDPAAGYAYIYGFICHFALDVRCHGYIMEEIARSGIPHLELEAEMDRELLVQDGLDPLRHKVTGHLHPSQENAQVIQAFFSEVDGRQVFKALKGMVRVLNLLVMASETKRRLLKGLLKISGFYEEMRGLIPNRDKNPLCDESTGKLLQLYGEAKELAVCLIEEYRSYVEGEAGLNEIYRYNFNAKKI